VPEISGNPKPVAIMSDAYAFTPSAFDSDGDALSFSIRNRPLWATFDTATGRLDGIPQFGDVGTYADIVISVSDGNATASLPAFSVVVSQDGLGSVTLEWVPPQSNTDRVDNVGLTAYVVDGLKPAGYFFTATAFNSAGVESDYSNEVARVVVIN
jgi:hypothetical protein